MASSFEARWSALELEIVKAEYPLDVLPHGAFARYRVSVVAPLAAKLDGDDLRIVFNAGLALAQLPHVDAIVPHIVQRLDDPHPLVASHMRWLLRELRPAAYPALLDCYATRPDRGPIAAAFGFLGPAAARLADVMRLDARDDPRIAAALRELEGPWDEAPECALRYIGESVRLDSDGPPSIEAFGLALWLDLVQWHAQVAAHDWNLWSRAAWSGEREVKIEWSPYQVAIAQPELRVGAYSFDTDEVVTTTIAAANRRWFTKQELLWKALVAHHRIAPCNDRIFEGLNRESDGSYYISTGS